MQGRRRKHGWPFWSRMALTVLVLYVASLGPVHSLGQHFLHSLPEPVSFAITSYCWPLHVIEQFGPEWLQSVMFQYIALWL